MVLNRCDQNWLHKGRVNRAFGLFGLLCHDFSLIYRRINPVRPGSKRRKIMNRSQRNAWFSLLFVAPVWLIFGQLPILLVYLEGPSFLHLFSFACSTIVGGLFWLFLLLFNRKAQKDFDERDRFIFTRATLAAYVVLWLYFIAACIYTWLYVAPERSISVNVMPMVIVGGIVVFHLAQSIATLIQYGRGGKGEQT